MSLTIFGLIVMIFSLVLHEISHGFAALAMGDNTAKDSGRLSLNPLNHLDPFGSVLVPLLLFWTGSPVIFGWAKPVPINPYNFKNPKRDILKVSLAGPAANFAVAIFFGLLIRFLPLPENLLPFWGRIVAVNLLWGFFNLLPIPPLDGSQILFSLLPERFSGLKQLLRQYGFALLILFVFFGFRILSVIVNLVYRLLIGV